MLLILARINQMCCQCGPRVKKSCPPLGCLPSNCFLFSPKKIILFLILPFVFDAIEHVFDVIGEWQYIRGLKLKLIGGPHSKEKIIRGPQFREKKA